MKERIQNQWRCPVVCDDVTLAFAILHRMPVAEGDCKGTSLGVVGEATKRFGPLKAVLGVIPAFYANGEVRQQPLLDSPLTNTLQESVTVGNKIEILLSHVIALEECFDSRPGDVAEQRRRDELIRYVAVPPLNLDLSTF